MANARAQRRSPADRIVRGGLVYGLPVLLLFGAAKVGLLDTTPDSKSDGPTEVNTAAPNSTTLRCLGLRAIHGDDRNLHVTPLFMGEVPEGTVMSYTVRYGGDLHGPVVAPLGEVIAPGHPDEVRADILVGGDPAQAIPCPPWKN